jgi:hypothetical protein
LQGALEGSTSSQRQAWRTAGYLLLFLSEQEIWLLTPYGMDETTDLTKDEKDQLKKALEVERVARKTRVENEEAKRNQAQSLRRADGAGYSALLPPVTLLCCRPVQIETARALPGENLAKFRIDGEVLNLPG